MKPPTQVNAGFNRRSLKFLKNLQSLRVQIQFARSTPGMQQLRFFNPYTDIHQTGDRLPHWQQVGAVYFVTFRLGDAMPLHLLARWERNRDA